MSLTVRLLGAFRIWRDDELLGPEVWHTQKTQTLLKILLTERGRVVSKDRLIEMLWSNLTPESAANSLHVATSRLRRILEPELERSSNSRYILTKSGGYLFSSGSDCWIDVDSFWESLAKGKLRAERGEWALAIAARERLQEAYLGTLSRLAECQARLGDYHQAVAACESVLAREPVRESVYRQVMAYHYRLGQRDQALHAYERCRNALSKNLGVDPMPQTRELHTRILQEKPIDEPVSFQSRPTPKKVRRQVSLDEFPVVGRDDELQTLNDHLAEVITSQGRLVFITGEAGIGKTRLAEAFLTLAKARSAQVLRGKCHQVEQDLPYQPVRQALRPYLTRRLTPEKIRGLLGPWAQQIAMILPEVRELAPNLPDPKPQPPEQARRELLHGLVQFCLALAKLYPLVLFLDDLQWADPSTLQFLHRFVHRIQEEQVMILGTFRGDEMGADHPLTEVVQGLVREGLAAQLALRSLSQEAVAELVDRKAVPEWDSAPFSRRLYDETEGNPLYLTELLQSLLDEGSLVEDRSGRWKPGVQVQLPDVTLRLPKTVQIAIESRCHRVSEMAQGVLAAAAVIGQRFEFELLQEASEFETDTLLDALDELLARRLIREPSEADNEEYVFSHDKIRETVYEGLNRARRKHLHRKTALALATVSAEHTEEVAGQLAQHHVRAGMHYEALHNLILAGDRAARQYAHTEAVAHYNQALEIIDRAEVSWEQLVHLFTRRGRVLELDSQYDEALVNYEEMEKLARQLGDRPMKLTALMAQVTLHATFTSLFDAARAEDLAERAVSLARDLDDQATEAKLLWNQSLLYRNTNRLPEAVECGERSLAISRELGLREQAAFALHDLGGAYGFLGPLEQAVAAFEEVGELWRELDNLPMLADSLAGLSQVFTFAGDYERALASAEQAFEMGASIDNVWVQVSSKGGHIGIIYWEMGRPDKAIPVLEECLRLIEEADLDSLVFPRASAGFVYGRLGAVERSLEILHRELKTAETQVRLALPTIRGMLAQLHLQHDRVTEAEAVINQSRESTDKAWGLIYFSWLRLAEGELALRQDNIERALAVTGDFLAELRDYGGGAHIPPALTIRGRALLAGGRIEAAQQTLEKARAKAEAIGSRQRMWQILAASAEVETRRGNDEQSEHLRRQAREILRNIADHTPTPELQASFLARPDVRALLKEG